MSICRLFSVFSIAIVAFASPCCAAAQSGNTVKVFLLAGQSNMQGHGVVNRSQPNIKNGGRGTLVELQEQKPALFQQAFDSENKSWNTRTDVFLRHQTNHKLKTGGLTIGFTGHKDDQHIGPEFQFGHVIGKHFEEPVLLIKTAWGGKSLFKDFRPPSSSGDVGPYYQKMLEEYKTGIAQMATEFPQLAGKTPELAGFVWMQGWNDMVNAKATEGYEENLVQLIHDIRKDLNAPNLPIVVGELGNGGDENPNPKMKGFRQAQLRATGHGEFAGNVAFVKTTSFARPKENSPAPRQGHHWFGNAESYFMIGNAMGRSMIDLMKIPTKKRVLILGDSISIGYGPTATKKLEDIAWVIRPKKTNGRPENCQGTNYGIAHIDDWLQIGGGKWDLIHFNFGLHDLKHVQPNTQKNSNNPDHPQQADVATYEKQLRKIVQKLKATNAKLIYCTTTPFPAGTKPFRDPKSADIYNTAAKKVMSENDIPINDLHTAILPELDKYQKPVDVHFNGKGSQFMGGKVAESIRKALQK